MKEDWEVKAIWIGIVANSKWTKGFEDQVNGHRLQVASASWKSKFEKMENQHLLHT